MTELQTAPASTTPPAAPAHPIASAATAQSQPQSQSEATSNGFTAVNSNGHISPPPPPSSLPPPSQASARDTFKTIAPMPSAERPQWPTSETVRNVLPPPPPPPPPAPPAMHPSNPGMSPEHASHKRKRSDEINSVTSEGTEGSSSSSTLSRNAQKPDAPRSGPAGAENGHQSWSSSPKEDQNDSLRRILAPVERANQANQQHINGGPNMLPPILHPDAVPNGNYILSQANEDRLIDMQIEAGNGQSTNPVTGLVTSKAGVEHDPKKRKRIFANRTKTGCQTCRKRKKKCDEAKPECLNCQRGGFTCAGYVPKVAWQPGEPRSKQQKPMPHDELAGHLGQEYEGNHLRSDMRPEALPYPEMPPNHSSPPATVRPRLPQIESEVDRPVNSAWPHSPYTPSHRSYSDDQGSVHGTSASPSITMRNPYSPNLQSMPAVPHGMPPPSRPYHTVEFAQRALQHTPSRDVHPLSSAYRESPNFRERDPIRLRENPGTSEERRRMLNGELYKPFAYELEQDRERCFRLLHNFNTVNHVNRDERMRTLASVFLSDDSPLGRRPNQPSSRLGLPVVVDVPFVCEYGYNITIGNDVHIESGCHMSDPRPIIIGDGTYIGPGVKIMGKVLPLSVNDRRDMVREGKAIGYEITIGKNVHIGAGVVIAPKEEEFENGLRRLTIGDGVYIEPNAYVSRNIPAYTRWGMKSTGEVLMALVP